MSDTEGTTPDWDRLLERFGDAYAAAYVEQTNASDARRTAAADAIRAAVASLTQDRDEARRELDLLTRQRELLQDTRDRLRRRLAAAREQAEHTARRQQALADILREILGGHWEAGHPGYSATRTSWIRAERLSEWRRLLPTYAAPVPLATSAPQPKDASACGRSLTEGWCPDHQTGTPPAAAVPSSGGRDRCGVSGPNGAKCNRLTDHGQRDPRHLGVDDDGEERCWRTPEASGDQDTAADEPTVFCPRTGQIGTGDDGCAPGTHQPQPSQADLFRALVGADPQSATAGGTASSEPCCRCEYEDGDGIDCPVHPDPEPVEASSEQGEVAP